MNMEYFNNYCSSFKNMKSLLVYKSVILDAERVCGIDSEFFKMDDFLFYRNNLVRKVTEDNMSVNSASLKLRVLRCYLSYLSDEGLINESFDFSPDLKIDFQSVGNVASIKDIDTLFSLCTDRMIHLVLALTIKAGLTSGEIISLSRTRDCIEYVDDDVYLHYSKGGFKKTIKLTSDLRGLLSEYLAEYPSDSSDNALFLNKRGKKLTLRTLQRYVLSFVSSCGFNYTLRDLRNAGIIIMLSSGHDEAEVCEVVNSSGHSFKRFQDARSLLNDDSFGVSAIVVKPFQNVV